MKKTVLIIAIFLGFVTRSYQFKDRFLYDHDHDLASWIVRDIIVDHHPRLIGQLTSSPGIFIGPLFYYALIPFYLMGHMDPLPTVAITWILGVLSIASVYYVFNKLYNPFSAKVVSLMYAVSFFLSNNDRRVVPTTPVMLWSIWYFYAINLLYSGNRSSLLILAILFALVWHINLALALLFPIVVLGVIVARKSFKIKDFVLPIVVFMVLSAPLIVFEARHNFQQTRALGQTLSSVGKHSETTGTLNEESKWHKTIRYIARNTNNIFLNVEPSGIKLYVIPVVLLIALLFLRFRKSESVIYSLWIALYVAFFSLHPINLSEYYLSGLDILILAGFTFLANSLRMNKVGFIVVIIGLTFLIARNFGQILSVGTFQIGYVPKKAIVNEIKEDAIRNGYPCVAVSYITDVGYNFGYRYFLWLAGLHVNSPSSGSPVYSIVFPLSRVDKVDKTFGALGLIYPDYSKYNIIDVEKTCLGEDHNLTGDMFGFTK